MDLPLFFFLTRVIVPKVNNKYRSLAVFDAVQQDEIPVPKIFILNHALLIGTLSI